MELFTQPLVLAPTIEELTATKDRTNFQQRMIGGSWQVGAGSTQFGVNQDGMRFGAEKWSDAPWRVTPAGVMTATGVVITGTVTQTGGATGGWTVTATTITSGNITLDSSVPRILISDGTNNRVLIGKHASGF